MEYNGVKIPVEITYNRLDDKKAEYELFISSEHLQNKPKKNLRRSF